jgi:hypothetical protein
MNHHQHRAIEIRLDEVSRRTAAAILGHANADRTIREMLLLLAADGQTTALEAALAHTIANAGNVATELIALSA